MFRRRQKGVLREKSAFIFGVLLGVFLLLFSCLALLAQFGYVFFLPASLFSSGSLLVLLLLLAIYFLREGFYKRMTEGKRFFLLFVGFVLLAFSLFPLLVWVGVFRFLPVYIELAPSPLLLALLMFFLGLYFIVDRFLLIIS
ncbi:hypothetical protein HZA98_00165 [Candidatus Woesearchaeota archaeon]|nr:hypothetical protein [Candidatus Woesearchaeota archaeon]